MSRWSDIFLSGSSGCLNYPADGALNCISSVIRAAKHVFQRPLGYVPPALHTDTVPEHEVHMSGCFPHFGCKPKLNAQRTDRTAVKHTRTCTHTHWHSCWHLLSFVHVSSRKFFFQSSFVVCTWLQGTIKNPSCPKTPSFFCSCHVGSANCSTSGVEWNSPQTGQALTLFHT